jgi:P-type Cu+ transporter
MAWPAIRFIRWGKDLEQEGVMSMEKIKDFDFVCGAEFDRDKSAGSYDYKGKTYYFCSEHCRESFIRNPDVFTK